VSRARRASFMVRVVRDRRGQVSGVIERVATGAKEAFHGVEAIGPVIARMVQREEAGPPAGGEDDGDSASTRKPEAVVTSGSSSGTDLLTSRR
jgi:hypothetical protein